MSTHPFLARIDQWTTPVAQVVTRLVFGQAFALIGWGKLQNLERVTQSFTDLGIPAPAIQAPMIATIEFVGGILLIAGLGTRLAALLLTGTMVVATATAHAAELGEGFTFAKSFADISPLPFLVAMLWLLAKGAGKLSVDELVFGRGKKKAD